MATKIVKLPNGLYGRFSTVVDEFTHMNYTKQEMEYLLETEYRMFPIQHDRLFKDLYLWEHACKRVHLVHKTFPPFTNRESR